MAQSDIIIGPARVFYAPYGEALPDENTIDFGDAWGGNWTELGYTKTPVTLSRDVSTADVRVEQTTLVVKKAITEESVAIETTLAELTTDHLELGMGGTVTDTAAGVGQVGMSELDAGGTATLTERAWGIEGEYVDASGVSFPVRVFVYRATAVLNGALEFGKADSVGIPLRIDCMGDLTKSVGSQLLKVQIVTAAAT